MDLLTNLPEDLIIVIVGTLYRTSKISVVVWAHVNKFSYKVACKCAKENKINRILQCPEIAAEGSLEVLKWARSNGCDWDYRTCAWAAENGHLEVLKWARSNGCDWDHDTEKLAKQKWPNVFS